MTRPVSSGAETGTDLSCGCCPRLNNGEGCAGGGGLIRSLAGGVEGVGWPPAGSWRYGLAVSVPDSQRQRSPSGSSPAWVMIPDSACSRPAASTTTAGAGPSSTTSMFPFPSMRNSTLVATFSSLRVPVCEGTDTV